MANQQNSIWITCFQINKLPALKRLYIGTVSHYFVDIRNVFQCPNANHFASRVIDATGDVKVEVAAV